MTFKQAKKKLAKIANGNYYSLSYEGTIWNKAFARLAGKKINTELTEAPTQEA